MWTIVQRVSMSTVSGDFTSYQDDNPAKNWSAATPTDPGEWLIVYGGREYSVPLCVPTSAESFAG